MTEQNIIQLFQQKRQWEAELSILRDCSDELHDFSSAEQAMRFALGSICWFPKYSGYVLTLNQVPETTNPKKQKIAKSVKRFLYNTLNKKIRVNEKR